MARSSQAWSGSSEHRPCSRGEFLERLLASAEAKRRGRVEEEDEEQIGRAVAGAGGFTADGEKMGMQQLNLAQYRAEKALPTGLGVDIRCRIPEVIAVPLLEVQPAHVIGDWNVGCIGAPDSPPGALHAAWPPVRAVPVLGRRPGVNLRNQSVCATPFACLCFARSWTGTRRRAQMSRDTPAHSSHSQ